MFGFGWVRTHLGVVFGEAFGLFWNLGLIFGKKGRNQQNLAKFRVLRHDVGIPAQQCKPTLRRGMSTPRCG